VTPDEECPPPTHPKTMEELQKDQMVDQFTSDLFYEMLAEVISEPVPQRREGMGPCDSPFSPSRIEYNK